MSHGNLTPLRGPSVWERPQLTSNTDRASLERALVGGAGLLLLNRLWTTQVFGVVCCG